MSAKSNKSYISLEAIDNYNIKSTRSFQINGLLSRDKQVTPSGHLLYDLYFCTDTSEVFPHSLVVFIEGVLLRSHANAISYIESPTSRRIVKKSVIINIMEAKSELAKTNNDVVKYFVQNNHDVLAIQYCLHILKEFRFIESLKAFKSLILIHCSKGLCSETKVIKNELRGTLAELQIFKHNQTTVYSLYAYPTGIRNTLLKLTLPTVRERMPELLNFLEWSNGSQGKKIKEKLIYYNKNTT